MGQEIKRARGLAARLWIKVVLPRDPPNPNTATISGRPRSQRAHLARSSGMNAERENATGAATATLVNKKASIPGVQERLSAHKHVLPGSAASVNKQYGPPIRVARRDEPAFQRNSVRSLNRHVVPGCIVLAGDLRHPIRVNRDMMMDEVAVDGQDPDR